MAEGRGRMEALVLSYIIKQIFLPEGTKEAKDSLTETPRSPLQEQPEQVGHGRLSPLAGGPLRRGMVCLVLEPDLCFLLG